MGHGEEDIAQNVPYINGVFVFFEEVTFNCHPPIQTVTFKFCGQADYQGP